MVSSSSPEARSPPSPLDSLAGDVRQRLMFDWQESRFGEMAEPDPLSFGTPQQAQRAQQTDRAVQNMGAMSNTFQVWRKAPCILECSKHAFESNLAGSLPLLVGHSYRTQNRKHEGNTTSYLEPCCAAWLGLCKFPQLNAQLAQLFLTSAKGCGGSQ